MHVVAVGTVAFDSIETPFGAVDRVLGGSATYIALSARFFCPDIGVVAVVGDDFPEAYLSVLRDCDVDLEGLEIKEGGRTFAWAGRYHYDLNDRETLATHLNVLTEFEPRVPERYKSGSIVCLGNLDPSIQRSVVEQVPDPRLVVCDTMNYWIEKTPDALVETLGLVDCLIINDSEARQLANESNLVRAAGMIRRMGPRVLIIKKGEHGALLFTDDGVFSAPAYPLEDIHDPTGAGDSFMGGFVGHLASVQDISIDALKRAVVYGSAVASFSVEQFGPDRLLTVSESDIDRRAQSFRDMSAIPSLSPLYSG